jgi:hypothetical protein
MSTWVPICPECRVPLRGDVELHEPPKPAESTPEGAVTCRFCEGTVDVDETTKWARVA